MTLEIATKSQIDRGMPPVPPGPRIQGPKVPTKPFPSTVGPQIPVTVKDAADSLKNLTVSRNAQYPRIISKEVPLVAGTSTSENLVEELSLSETANVQYEEIIQQLKDTIQIITEENERLSEENAILKRIIRDRKDGIRTYPSII